MRNKSALFASLMILVVALVMLSCSEDRVTDSYEAHPPNWMDIYSPDWHGQAAIGSKGESCSSCHYTGVPTGDVYPLSEGPETQLPTEQRVAEGKCADCHAYPHGEGYATDHARVIRNFEWQTVSTCRACHGTDFAGGRTGASCKDCHTQSAGPAACNTCHGLPPSTANPLGTNNPGAHYAHTRYACTECHNSVNGLNHIDALPADVRFDDARISTAAGYPATYTNQSNCATYCHSNLLQGAPIVPVQWGNGQTLTSCRSCHSVPPTSALHPNSPTCHLCHLNVDPSSNYNDANQIRFLPGDTLHVNGVVNAIFQ